MDVTDACKDPRVLPISPPVPIPLPKKLGSGSWRDRRPPIPRGAPRMAWVADWIRCGRPRLGAQGSGPSPHRLLSGFLPNCQASVLMLRCKHGKPPWGQDRRPAGPPGWPEPRKASLRRLNPLFGGLAGWIHTEPGRLRFPPTVGPDDTRPRSSERWHADPQATPWEPADCQRLTPFSPAPEKRMTPHTIRQGLKVGHAWLKATPLDNLEPGLSKPQDTP